MRSVALFALDPCRFPNVARQPAYMLGERVTSTHEEGLERRFPNEVRRPKTFTAPSAP